VDREPIWQDLAPELLLTIKSTLLNPLKAASQGILFN
jgi:hypothetical protein